MGSLGSCCPGVEEVQGLKSRCCCSCGAKNQIALLLCMLWDRDLTVAARHIRAWACSLQERKDRAGTERSLLAQLAAGNPAVLEPGGAYRLVPRAWLAVWRAYIDSAPKRGCAHVCPLWALKVERLPPSGFACLVG